jgi:ABC-2 type transport system ATP-binding protein
MTPILQVNNLNKTYTSRSKQTVEAVKNVSFSVSAGQCFGLLGPNGAGKTSTLEIIENIRPMTSGDILYKGQPRDKHYSSHIGVVFQQTALPERLTVKECLQLFNGLYKTGVNTSQGLEKVINMFDLQDILTRYPHNLSGGQRQRLLLAMALAHDPDILFLDEPTTGLDPNMRRTFWQLINQVKQLGKAIVLTTHYMEEAEKLCDEIAIIDQGAIVAKGTPAELLKQHFEYTTIHLPETAQGHDLSQLPYTISNFEGALSFVTDNVNEAIQHLQKLNVNLEGLAIRPHNMDDLYRKITQAKPNNLTTPIT